VPDLPEKELRYEDLPYARESTGGREQLIAELQARLKDAEGRHNYKQASEVRSVALGKCKERLVEAEQARDEAQRERDEEKSYRLKVERIWKEKAHEAQARVRQLEKGLRKLVDEVPFYATANTPDDDKLLNNLLREAAQSLPDPEEK
jgi:hypothetical protein